jgi:SAM-dependent methyltransferase
MIRILRFHWRMYAGTLLAAAAVPLLPPPYRVPAAIAATPAIFWFAASLLVSWYVYDHGPLAGADWLSRCISRPPARWLNLHAGLDYATPALARLFPSAAGETLDIFDPREMTKLSIARARRMVHAPAGAPGGLWSALPVASASVDDAFLIFTAHELRRPQSRVRLFRELARVLRADGEVIVVEHLRDWRNFVAFGPGFLHFLPGHAWRGAAAAAGLRVVRDFPITPFVRVFVVARALKPAGPALMAACFPSLTAQGLL